MAKGKGKRLDWRVEKERQTKRMNSRVKTTPWLGAVFSGRSLQREIFNSCHRVWYLLKVGEKIFVRACVLFPSDIFPINTEANI